MSIESYDFSGWVTKANIRCSDGRTIMKDAFAHNDGQIVPLVWNHQHNGPDYVLGQILLENRDEGVYGYGKFNDTEAGKTAKLLVQHGDVDSLSIYANQLKESMSNVIHGNIREVSLVLAGANIGAHIDNIIAHGEESDEEAYIYSGEDIMLSHSEIEATEEDNTVSNEEVEETVEVETTEEVEETVEVETTEKVEETEEAEETEQVEESKEDAESMAEELMHADTKAEKTVEDVFNELNDEQKNVVYYMIGEALKAADENSENDEGDDSTMKHNVFEQDEVKGTFLSHADQKNIIDLAKTSGVGSLKTAMTIYAEQNTALAHSFDDIEALFPDYVDAVPGAPGMIERDRDWVSTVLKKAHKSPAARVRTRHVDTRVAEVEAKGYKKGNQKEVSGAVKVLKRTTDPQTIYYRDNLHRDDVLDIDFDVIAYQKNIMKHALEEEIAIAALIGDGREDSHADKISEDHVRSIWNDDALYTIRATVDVEAARKELQGTDTAVYFGDNFVYAEAVVTAVMYARENYKGKGQLDFFCDPHLLNVMLLARDRNGRRIYESKEDLARVLNVGEIHEVEQFAGRTREDEAGKTKKLLGIFVNMANYQFGCVKGGEITTFEDFDLDFNTYKYLMETRLSGALINPYSAIALEEVAEEAAG